AARAAKLDALVLAPDSRRSGAAFALAYAERGPADPLWKKLMAQGRQRDRAHGLVGSFGGEASLVPDLASRLAPQRDEIEPPLCRALAFVALATLDGSARQAGAAKIVEWLRGPGAKADIAWRRLAVMCLGLADGDPKSLACLEPLITQGLAAQPLTVDVFTTDAPGDDYVLFLPALVALCARTDTTPLLTKVLEEATARRVRDTAARALSLRRHDTAAASILKSLEKAERYDWQELCRILDPLLKPSDAAAVNALLDSVNAPARSAGAYILSMRPDVGVDADTRGHLVTGLSDQSNVVRYYCASALGKRRAVSAVEKLVLLLRDDDDDVRSAAAEALGAIGDAEGCQAAAAASELQARLDTRWLKAMAIAGNPTHMALLLKLLKSAAYADQRAGYEALGASGRPAALEALVRTFRNEESAFQTVAGDALTQRPATAVAALRGDLQSTDRKARVRALHLLARLDTPASRAVLKQALDDEDAGVRALAEFGLSRLGAGAAGGARFVAPGK
ncbi:MAG: HEAT repeat domain-containing protein, partial [Planctomycetota bacterium]|nr:HEAT repeat domain-containing protein [Planctomycetota bacterium]